MKKAFDEEVFEFLKKKLESELKEQKKQKIDSGDVCDDICQALELCDKLLTHDYFKESEGMIDSFKTGLPELHSKWVKYYEIELRKKKKDMKKLFNIVVNNSEDWC